MRYPIEGTHWMSDSVGQHIKDLVATFYELADSKESDAGTRMATEVFTEDAVLITANGTFQGFLEISKSRENAWSIVNSRKHRVLKVFSGNDKVPELSILGTGEMKFKNGKEISSPFACYIRLESSDSGVRISLMQVFVVRFHCYIAIRSLDINIQPSDRIRPQFLQY
ncbi:hypothetical protein B0T10DRAFT_524260 [Thelonectria olida]|uniref:Uncharacterized protein n=1 Tax=Thelonectria olida TaxID=1576542 RepID=A0A9P8VR89_9HYPO|nr:hypothetical protein B0T10DRAFT_524260 [Thelonectria olida]